jgi:TRAP-type C4-dicarboxylate transport system substrate-binding protein
MDNINRRTLLKTAAATGAALAAPVFVRSAAARTTTITTASLLGDDKPESKIWVKIGELVEARLPGQFKFNVVKNGALGGEKEVAEGARLGSVQASLSTVSSLSGWVPELQVLDLPFLFRDAAHVRKTVDGNVGADLKQKLAAQNFVIGDFINYGARHLLTKEPVTRPEQLKGKKIRVIQSPLHTKLWAAFGTAPVGIPITETYNALATGVADAMDLTKSAYAGFKLYEVVPCYDRNRPYLGVRRHLLFRQLLEPVERRAEGGLPGGVEGRGRVFQPAHRRRRGGIRRRVAQEWRQIAEAGSLRGMAEGRSGRLAGFCRDRRRHRQDQVDSVGLMRFFES